MLRVISDILDALDRGDLAALTLLDLSAAFDNVDHKTLIRRLETSYGIRCTVLDWFSTYLPCVPKKTVVPNFGDNFVKS